jgi:hypothetical protein
MTMPEQTEGPRAKLLMFYDIIPETQQAYYEFILREFIPHLQELGLVVTQAWHTAYGNYPVRMTAFVAPDMDTVRRALASPEWKDLNERLEPFVTHLSYKVVRYREGFQF